MAESNLVERRNRFFFGNDLRAKITCNLMRIGGIALFLLGISAAVAILVVCNSIVIPSSLIMIVGLSGGLGVMLLPLLTELLMMKIFDKANKLEQDYKDGKFRDFKDDSADDWFELGKTFIKTIANTIVEHAKKIWTNFQHFFFGNNKRKRNSFIFMSIVGGLIFLFAFTIPFALLVANIVGVAFYATVTSVGITVGTIMLTIGVCYSQNPRYKQAVKEPESVSADKSDLISSAVPTEIALEAQNKPANNGKDTSSPRFMPAPKEHPENRLKQSYEIDDASRDWMEAHSMSLNFGSRE